MPLLVPRQENVDFCAYTDGESNSHSRMDAPFYITGGRDAIEAPALLRSRDAHKYTTHDYENLEIDILVNVDEEDTTWNWLR